MNFSRTIVLERLVLFSILVVAFLLRFWDLTLIGLRGDEAVYAGQSLIMAGDQEMTRFFVLASRGTSNFLFHQGVQAFVYSTVGFSDLSARLLPVVFSVLTVVLVFLLGRELFGRWTGLLAAFLLAINGYAVSLGRIALLDSTMTFFFVLSMLFLAKWMKTGQSNWAYAGAATTGIAIMAKVPSALIIPLALLIVLSIGRFRGLRHQTIVVSILIFAASLTPAIFQLTSNPALLFDFLFEGTSRASNVPATYYLDKLVSFAGPLFIIITSLGIAASAVFRKRGDLLCLIWLAVVAVFFQIYPLKGFNYVLPLVPVAALLGARGLVAIVGFLRRPALWSPRGSLHTATRTILAVAAIFLLISASYSMGYSSLQNIVYDRPFVGLREASYWLHDNAPDAGAMTISHGSAQYVLSLYGKIDAYPFGDFRLHTFLPGGTIIAGPPPADPLIQNSTVTFLVHYVSWGGDDPIHVQVKTPTEERFINLIQKYQSDVRYVFYYEFMGLDGTHVREPRVWIYEVGKRLPEPVLQVQVNGDSLFLNGAGFLINSNVSVYNGRTLIGKFPTDGMGSFTGSIRLPEGQVHGDLLEVFDEGKRNRILTSIGSHLADDRTETGKR
ncbi:MAG: ArnT family glycosyltransferase [Candidatus Bathyarchaeia archaeon]